MRLTCISIIVAFSVCLSAAAYADLDSPTYGKARDAYVKGDCYEGLPLLKKYKSEDQEFLYRNPNVLSAISEAIDYCEAVLSIYMPGKYYPTGLPQKHDLPPNMAHAFDSEARLRMVIGELKSGKPDYEHMEPMLRIEVRQQAATLAPWLKDLGTLISLSYEGQEEGADVYEAKFKNGTAACMIGIAPNGNISVLVIQ